MLLGIYTTRKHNIYKKYLSKSWRDKLIFLEDVGESAYRLDRLMHQFLLAGELEHAQGIILGDFTDVGKEDPEWKETLWREVAQWTDCPIWTGFSIGHEAENWMVPCGVNGTIQDHCLVLGNGGKESP